MSFELDKALLSRKNTANQEYMALFHQLSVKKCQICRFVTLLFTFGGL